MAKKAGKAIERSSKYAGADRPCVDYSDVVKVTTGKYGILLSFCQDYPGREELTVIRDIFLPVDVCENLAKILTDQVANYPKLLAELDGGSKKSAE